MDNYRLHRGNSPLIISVPHCGGYVPESIEQRFTERALALPDADWHVDQLYHFAKEMDVTMISAIYHRYVVDLNRPPDNHSLYPGQFTTGICPIQLFDQTPLYHDGRGPDDEEVQQRIRDYWQPYHDQLSELISHLHSQHGYVLLYDAHSIRAHVPSLFDGKLPDLNLGTDDGKSCDKALEEALYSICDKSPFSSTLNGRFKGGYITRHYANLRENIHTVQMELTQRNYMEEAPPYTYLNDKAEKLQATLKPVIQAMLDWRPTPVNGLG